MGVGVHQHICRGVSCGTLNGLHIAARDHQLIGCTGMPQTVEHNTGELWVCVLPFQKLLADEHRLDRQTVGQTEQHSTVMVTCRVFHLVCRQLIQPFLQFLFQSRGHEDSAAGGRRLSTFQDEGSGAAFQLVREYLDDAAIVHLIQGFFPHPLHGLVDTEGSDTICCVKVKIFRGQTYDLSLSQCAHQCKIDCQISKVANDLFRSMNLAQSGLNLDTDDLKQAGNLGLWKAVPKFDAARDMKFLTYAAPAIRNAMMDMVRDAFTAFEQRMVTEDKDGICYQCVSLDDVLPGEEQLRRIEATADPYAMQPQSIMEEQKSRRELYDGLKRLTQREQTYLLYR